jgi:hypothetical protein|tara:strand:- start:154 stop:318 length:165 start_codon:yes stop_codon:yes gene_type:complete
MDYYDSAEGFVLTRQRTIQEIAEHNASSDIDDFYSIYGLKEEYNAQDVLNWLGY